MSTRKIVTNTIYYGVVPKLSMLLSIVMLPLTTPFLTTFDYGVYGVLTSYTSLFVSVAPLGLHVHLTNSYFELPRHYNLVWGRVLLMILLSSLFFGLLNIVILLLTLPMGISLEGMALCVVGSVPIFLLANGLLAQHIFPLVENPRPLVFTNLLGAVLGMLVSFVLIWWFRLGYWGLISSGFVSAIFTFTVFVKFVWHDFKIRPIWDHNMRRVRWMLKVALPLVPHTLGFVLLTSSARIVMSQYHVSYDDIGLFSHGSAMGDYAVVITSALALALMPQIQRAYRSADYSAYRRLYFLCQVVALLTSFLICIWMPEIYGLLIRNESLAKSCDIASLLCFANVVYSFYVFMSAPAFIEKDTMQLLWLVFVPGILNFVLCYTLIPMFGYRAAIWSTIVSYWSQLLIPFVVGYYRRSVRKWLCDRRLILLLLVVIIADLLLANEAIQFSLWMKLGLTLLSAGLLVLFYLRSHLSQVL